MHFFGKELRDEHPFQKCRHYVAVSLQSLGGIGGGDKEWQKGW